MDATDFMALAKLDAWLWLWYGKQAVTISVSLFCSRLLVLHNTYFVDKQAEFDESNDA